MLWLRLDPVPLVLCGRILPFSGAWAGVLGRIPKKGHLKKRMFGLIGSECGVSIVRL
jgi:hypothetical protein